MCVFEHVYFSNPASRIFGQNVHLTREAMGRQLAREAPVEADFVMPMPDSGRSAAMGFAKESGIEFEEGIVPNRFVGRTFILPGQAQRDRAVAMKLNIIPDVVRGKRIVIVEDSVVRGTTTRSKMRAIRRAGAKEIHLRVSCPPIRHPCFYGIDFPTSEELIAHNRTVSGGGRVPGSGQPGLPVDGRHARVHERAAQPILHRLLERQIQDPDRPAAEQIQLRAGSVENVLGAVRNAAGRGLAASGQL